MTSIENKRENGERMSKVLFTLRQAEISLEKSYGYFSTVASAYKKKRDRFPDWYVLRGGNAFIDVDEFEKMESLYDRVKIYCNKKLYWALKATNHSDSDIARLLDDRSAKFKGIENWTNFLNSSLFSNGEEKQQRLKGSKMEDFLKIVSKYLFEKIMKNELYLSKADKFF